MLPSGDVELLGATVDDVVQRNVPLPTQQQQQHQQQKQRQTNSVLAGMINSAKSNKSSGVHHSGIHVPSSSSSMPATTSTTNPLPSLSSTSSSSSDYVPSSPLPSCLQFAQSSHPTACLFHILFKCLALGVYMTGSKLFFLLHNDDVLVTVVCILLLAADFWVVKNITGRLLVGLRWWNIVDVTTGETSWIFESAISDAAATTTTTPNNSSSSSSRGENNKNNTFDSNFYWAVLYLTPILWCILSLSAILWLNFHNLVTLICALVL